MFQWNVSSVPLDRTTFTWSCSWVGGFFLWIAFQLDKVMLFVAILPIFYVIFHMTPSNCGPFVGQHQFYSVVTDFYYNDIPGKYVDFFVWHLISKDNVRKLLDHIITPSFMVPAVCVMVLVIYYLQSVSRYFTVQSRNHSLYQEE